jgi:hypothetical protein
MKRPGLQEALSQLRQADTLVVWKLDRLIAAAGPEVTETYIDFFTPAAVVERVVRYNDNPRPRTKPGQSAMRRGRRTRPCRPPFPFERRDLRPNDILKEVLYTGICHTDLHQKNDGRLRACQADSAGRPPEAKDDLRRPSIRSEEIGSIGSRATMFEL